MRIVLYCLRLSIVITIATGAYCFIHSDHNVRPRCKLGDLPIRSDSGAFLRPQPHYAYWSHFSIDWICHSTRRVIDARAGVFWCVSSRSKQAHYDTAVCWVGEMNCGYFVGSVDVLWTKWSEALLICGQIIKTLASVVEFSGEEYNRTYLVAPLLILPGQKASELAVAADFRPDGYWQFP